MVNTVKCKKEGYSQIRNEALAYAFSYMNLIEHWGSGIPRIIEKVKAAGLRESEFIGGEVDLRINIYRGQVESVGKVPESDLNDLKNDPNDLKTKMIALIHEKPELTYAEFATRLSVSTVTIKRNLAKLQEEGLVVREGSKRKGKWILKE